ncbi:formyltetrahydrofolate deformylase [Oxynema aestuarii]|jgi:formyltetrahydrofolate deformylase|uniref:Formyltetrahydrofolate deformylase n=1 Tax=Oxynema aestuarii AP17 TaxID=2064643 RepID=A0A6H1U1U5_9CYAN|nr:formyltetrahydrofolate deformylase [Oxynema aestuarii]QIZ72416.1 formyltetrahydrofolate deformylase [Oxynema aestuarii AP17]RMH77749.1 MAG: formyltetrahydrofolate deformylase [Cyanobacteria bacterium J007]
MTSPTATLLLSCPDRRGLVAEIANFIYSHGGNIVHADHHTDFTRKIFLTRLEWQLEGFDLSREQIAPACEQLAGSLQANWQLHFSDTVRRLSIWVSRQDHCLLDLLWRQKAKEFTAEIPLIISNHEDLKEIAIQFGADFHYLPITPDNKAEQEEKQLQLLRDYQIDIVVLAKYMQILRHNFITRFPNIINIHHSFLPAFVGAKPYHQAYKRGVKIIGATAHYVTDELDAGPIIEQDVVRVSHRDEIADLIRKGKDLERIVLARAVRSHLQNRVLVYGDRTVVFG